MVAQKTFSDETPHTSFFMGPLYDGAVVEITCPGGLDDEWSFDVACKIDEADGSPLWLCKRNRKLLDRENGKTTWSV